jgi:hypothetical protein
MNTTLDTALWFHTDTGYPGSQQRDLHGSYWAEVAPVSYAFGWSWTILDSDSTEMDGGWTQDEGEAKAAVEDWAETDLLVAQITSELLSAAFAVHGYTDDAIAHAALAVAATTQIAR